MIEPRRARARAVAILCGTLACAPVGASSTSTTAPTTEPVSARREAKQAPGEVLEAVVPLVDGGTLDLASLRGTPVVLVLATTADDTFAPIRAALEELVARHPEGLAIVVVATDPAPELVPRTWPGGPTSVHVGWDPQGALATRLQVRTLPTHFVLNREGRVVVVRGGSEPAALDEITSAATRTAASAAPENAGR